MEGKEEERKRGRERESEGESNQRENTKNLGQNWEKYSKGKDTVQKCRRTSEEKILSTPKTRFPKFCPKWGKCQNFALKEVVLVRGMEKRNERESGNRWPLAPKKEKLSLIESREEERERRNSLFTFLSL